MVICFSAERIKNLVLSSKITNFMAAFCLKYTDAFSIIGSDQSGLKKCMHLFEWIFNSKFITRAVA